MCILQSVFLLLDRCTPGCLLTDLTPSGAVRQCADRGYANTLPIPSGVVCYNRTTAGSEAVYICDDGFQQNGAATRVCQSGGVWNGSIPQCLPNQDGQDGIMSFVLVCCHSGTNCSLMQASERREELLSYLQQQRFVSNLFPILISLKYFGSI